jgi:hypothetical protein
MAIINLDRDAERKASISRLVAYLSYALDEVRALSPISSYLLEMSIAAIKEDRPSQQQPRHHSDQKYS